MATNNIKVVAPASNPHICYISREQEYKIKYIRSHSKRSLYKIICISAGMSLSDKNKIHEFKAVLKALGYKNIGEWVSKLIDMLYESKDFDNIPKPSKKED